MRPLTYDRPEDARTAVRLVADDPAAMFLGGGTNLVDHLKLGIATPEHLVDVSRLPLDKVEDVDGVLRIGAAVRNSDLAAHPLVRQRFPMLSQALLAGASGQLRNTATTAGNLLQRTRCAYFQDVGAACNKRDPGSGCDAFAGWTRYHAVLGTSDHCIAAHPSDMAVAMVTLDADVVALGPDGERRVPLEHLHRLPGDRPDLETVLAHDELITAVELPALPLARRSTYVKVRDRASYAFALVSVAAAIEVEDGVVRDVRLGLGGVASKPWRARAAEDVLRGGPATAEQAERAADAELADARATDGNAFKLPMTRRAVVRAMDRLLAEEGPR